MRLSKKICFLILTIFLLHSATVLAQKLDISGVVTAEESGEFLPGTNISVKGTNFGTASDINGNFRLSLSNMSEATLVFTFIGYKSKEINITASTESMDVGLETDVLKTSEVVVTGLASSVKRQNLAHAVATVTAAELIPAPAQTIGGALSGKFSGINVSQNTGAPGGGIAINLRGVSTIEGATQPLYVIDGVIVNNAANQSGIDAVTKAAAAGSIRPQGQPTNRIADINLNDIENIEVLKGASAASIYGSKATNGVIVITTKQGTPGKTKIDVSQQIGFTSILNKIGSRRFETYSEALGQYSADLTAQGLNPSGLSEYNSFKAQVGADSISNMSASLLNQMFGSTWANGFIDYEDEMYGEKGLAQETSISVRGGSDRTQFYISGMFKDEGGIINNTGYKKYSGRLGITHKMSERANLKINANVIRSESDRGITGNDNSNTTFGFSLGATPSFLDIRKRADGSYPDHQNNPSNPIHTKDVLMNNEAVYRTIGSFRFNYNFLRSKAQSLDFIAQGGADFYSQENEVFSPPDLQYERNSDQPGTSISNTVESINSNLYLNLAHSYVTAGNSFTTTAGLQFEDQDLNNVLVIANNLVVTQTNVDQSASVNVLQNILKQKEHGFFVQEEANLAEKLFLTASLRGDASSNNGDVKKFYMFPKFSASARLSQYGFWQGLSSVAEEFKIRAAYGETGNLPIVNTKFTSLIPSNIGGTSGLLTAATSGDSEISPERTKELELGVDVQLLSGKANLELTYFNQNISDLLLFADVAPSSGFTQTAVNAGEMKTQGFETSLGLNLIRGVDFDWISRINFYKTSSEITKLDVPAFNKGGFATFLGTYRIEEGWSPTSIVGSEADVDGNFIKLGDETPDFQMSFNNRITFFKNFSLNFLWDWKKGGDIINLGKLITDLGGTSGDYEDKITDNGEKKNIGDWRLEVLGTQTAPYIEDGSYWKLRELSLHYTFERNTIKRFFGESLTYLKIGISGRNLIMISDYLGYDPEVSQFGNLAIGRSVDTIPFPSARSYYFNISFGL
jgi:TonB-dependent starch-binding outer membrane protein SusC